MNGLFLFFFLYITWTHGAGETYHIDGLVTDWMDSNCIGARLCCVVFLVEGRIGLFFFFGGGTTYNGRYESPESLERDV